MARIELAEFAREYPFQPRSIEIGRFKLNYVDEGPRDARRTVLALHGNPTWSFYWRALIKSAIADGDIRIVAPDYIGCGLSDKPTRDYGYRLEDRIEEIRQLIARLELADITLIVHDWGGAIGLGCAVGAPETIRSIILTNSAAFRSDRMPTRIALARTPILGPIAIERMNLFLRLALPPFSMASARAERFSDPIRKGYLYPYQRRIERKAIGEFVRDIPISERDRSYRTLKSIEDRLDRLADKKILILWGARDWCFDESFYRRWKEFFPRATSKIFADAGHWLMEDAHETITPEIIRFIKESTL